jgi:hypothetical protein
MNTAAIIDLARKAGVTLVTDGMKLACEGPQKEIDLLLPSLKAHKAEVIAALQSHRIPFNEDAMAMVKAGHPVRVWSGVLGEWLWWVRDEAGKKNLVADGVDPGCIYTLGELAVITGWKGELADRQAALKDIHVMKKSFDATVEAP